MIKAKIEYTSETTWDDKPKHGYKPGVAGIKEFENTEEMIKYALQFNIDIIISYPILDEEKEQYDYDVEIYNEYRE